jgi:hypothetical protein
MLQWRKSRLAMLLVALVGLAAALGNWGWQLHNWGW